MKSMKKVIFVVLMTLLTPLYSGINSRAIAAETAESEAVGAMLHSLTSMIRQARILAEYEVVDAARVLQTSVRGVYMALENGDLPTAQSGIELALFKLRRLEEKVDQANQPTLNDDIEDLSREYFYARSLLLDGSDDEKLIALYDTYLKTSTEQSVKLPSEEKCLIRANTSLIGKILGVVASHHKVEISQALPSCAIAKVGSVVYLYSGHAKLEK